MVNVLTDTFRSIEVVGKDDKTLRIDEGDVVKFSTEHGELIEGIVSKLSGKGGRAKIQICPTGAEREEIWSVLVMSEGSLEVVKE